jgi:hypothetical protein
VAAFLTDRDKATVFKSPRYLCTENVVRIDLVTESLNVGTMVALIFLFLNLIASPFMSLLIYSSSPSSS